MSDAVQIAKITALTIAICFFGWLAYESNQFEKVVGAVLFVLTPLGVYQFQKFQSTQATMQKNQDTIKQEQQEIKEGQNEAAKKAKDAADAAVSVKQVLKVHNENINEQLDSMAKDIKDHGVVIKEVQEQTNGMSQILQDQAKAKGDAAGYVRGTDDAKTRQDVKDAMIPKHD